MNPLSATFAAGVALKNTLYDRGILKSRKLARPVVSIGNISVGGSGKTPFTITLGRLLKERGIEFDVLSRGYGRKSKEVLAVDPEGSAERFGDEPLLIARKLDAPVIVGADRYRAGLLAEQKFPQSKLHLLDDGFQHRRLHRDLDIVLLQPDDFMDTLLPTGRLREDVSAVSRADIIVIHPGTPQSVRRLQKPVWEIHTSMRFSSPAKCVVAFCGIARYLRFYVGLERLGLDIADIFVFGDHHHYTQRNIDQFLESQAQTGATAFVTTEKDIVNLGRLAGQLPTLEPVVLELELINPAEALETLLEQLQLAISADK